MVVAVVAVAVAVAVAVGKLISHLCKQSRRSLSLGYRA